MITYILTKAVLQLFKSSVSPHSHVPLSVHDQIVSIYRHMRHGRIQKVLINGGYGGQMQVILNGEPLEVVDCFKYLGSQVAADGRCERDVVHRMNERYRLGER